MKVSNTIAVLIVTNIGSKSNYFKKMKKKNQNIFLTDDSICYY